MAKKRQGITPRYPEPGKGQGITPHYVDTSKGHVWRVILFLANGDEIESRCYAATFEEAEEQSLTQNGVINCIVMRPPIR